MPIYIKKIWNSDKTENKKMTAYGEISSRVTKVKRISFMSVLIINWTETIVRIINSLVVMILIHMQ